MKTITSLVALFIVILLVSCGPSLQEIQEAAAKAKKDSLLKAKNIVDSITVSKKYLSHTYLSSDFALIPGKVVGFEPNDASIDNNTEEFISGKSQIYIHIQTDDGVTKVYPIVYSTWLNLHIGDVLK